ncbi:hypothetical protein ABPG74_021237 [Tetrahymena malaccensis]
MLFKDIKNPALDIIKTKQDIAYASLQEKWQSSTLKEKLNNLEKKLLETKDEISILKEKFDKQRSCAIIRCKYYDYLLYEQILQRQITHQKNMILFGQQNESILDLDFYPIMFSCQLKSIGDQKYNNIISMLSLQNQFCIQEVRLFFYQILSNIRRHLKQFKNEASTQTEIIVAVQTNQNQLSSKYLSKNPNKLEYFRQISPQHHNNDKVFLFYYFMGQKHTYEIRELEMSVEEFLEDVFQQKAEQYEIVLIKNINLQQTKIDNSEHMFLIELQQMQSAYNIYVLPKSYQKQKNFDTQQEITKAKNKSIQSTDFEEAEDHFLQFQQKEQKISKQVDFTHFIDDLEETKDQYQHENFEQMEIIYEISNKNEEQELTNQIQTKIANDEKSNSELIKQQTQEELKLSQQKKQDQIFDLSDKNDKNEQKIEEKDAVDTLQSQFKSNEQTDDQKKDSSSQQDLISSTVQQSQESIQQTPADQQSQKNNPFINLFQFNLHKNENQPLVDSDKPTSLTSFEVLSSEKKSKFDEQNQKEQTSNTENQQQGVQELNSDSVSQ